MDFIGGDCVNVGHRLEDAVPVRNHVSYVLGSFRDTKEREERNPARKRYKPKRPKAIPGDPDHVLAFSDSVYPQRAICLVIHESKASRG
jgi:hypothetical protein